MFKSKKKQIKQYLVFDSKKGIIAKKAIADLIDDSNVQRCGICE